MTFVENLDNPLVAEIKGGCLTFLCSTKVKNKNDMMVNRKVLLMRGLNPSLSYLDTINVEDLVEGFLDDIMVEAMEKDCKYVAMPLYSLGALSNRHDVLSHLWQKYKRCERIKLNEDFAFNGHDIKDACVVVRVVGELEEFIPSDVPVHDIPNYVSAAYNGL